MKNDGEFGARRARCSTRRGAGRLSGAFYAPDEPRAPSRGAARGRRPAHYKVICISLYNDDLEQLDEMVDELKARGITKANRSALIRHALTRSISTRCRRGCELGHPSSSDSQKARDPRVAGPRRRRADR